MKATLSTEDAAQPTVARVGRSEPGPVFRLVEGAIVLGGDTTFHIGGKSLPFSGGTRVEIEPSDPGSDYFVTVDNAGKLIATVARTNDLDGVLGGFHYAPGGNAPARAGGDDVPAINPFSIWDLGFRPACPDPRGMVYVATATATPFWADIYLLGTRPFVDGTSRFGRTIADGRDRPLREDGVAYDRLDWPTAGEICAAFGKSLFGAEEFFAASFGVAEGTSLGHDPKTTGLDASRTSKYGLMQATGNMMIWGHNGDPDPNLRRPSIFGGSWDNGEFAGSRCASLDDWPGHSHEWFGVRARSDHLQLDA